MELQTVQRQLAPPNFRSEALVTLQSTALMCLLTLAIGIRESKQATQWPAGSNQIRHLSVVIVSTLDKGVRGFIMDSEVVIFTTHTGDQTSGGQQRLNPDEWAHTTFVYDADNNRGAIYVNGTFDSEMNNQQGPNGGGN